VWAGRGGGVVGDGVEKGEGRGHSVCCTTVTNGSNKWLFVEGDVLNG
jgi:hypothetical protein